MLYARGMKKENSNNALTLTRPAPPAEAVDVSIYGTFVPAPEVWQWIADTILRPGSPLYNPDHEHLIDADVGVLWTSAPNVSKGRQVIGTAETPTFTCGGWKRARQEMQIRQWFGGLPDFIITLDALHCAQASDVEFCALIEHELYHCAQAVDEFGVPKFNRDTGLPKFAIKGHDVEEFVGVVRRYGVTSEAVADLIIAASKPAEVSNLNIARACGTCMLRSA